LNDVRNKSGKDCTGEWKILLSRYALGFSTAALVT